MVSSVQLSAPFGVRTSHLTASCAQRASLSILALRHPFLCLCARYRYREKGVWRKAPRSAAPPRWTMPALPI